MTRQQQDVRTDIRREDNAIYIHGAHRGRGFDNLKINVEISAFNYWTVVLLVNASVVGRELEFVSTFDQTLLRINAVLVGLTAVGFILATRGSLGREQSAIPKPDEDTHVSTTDLA